MFTLDQVAPWGRSLRNIGACSLYANSWMTMIWESGKAATWIRKPFTGPQFLESCRVAREVRIFPLLALDGCTSRYIARMVHDLSDAWQVSLETVPYEFQRGGNQMMRIRPLERNYS